jgi:NAD(P)H-hydrate repair Nnr-like enzyme with NAD(P)H-hydrate dehydratase domain
MATAGTGDVLTGVIAALAAQGLSSADAARLGVYLHGLAGDIVAADRGERGMLAGDLLDRLPAALARIAPPPAQPPSRLFKRSESSSLARSDT